MGKENYLVDDTARMLNSEGQMPFDIAQNGEIRASGDFPSDVNPSTFNNGDLGGEYDKSPR